jgi:GntR family transcriptional regulator
MRGAPILVDASAATDEEQMRLALFPGMMVYRLQRICGQGEFLSVRDIRLPAALFPHLQKPVPSLTELADTYGLQLGEALERICAVTVSPVIAKVLDVAEGAPVLQLDRVVHLRNGGPAEWCIAYCRKGLNG